MKNDNYKTDPLRRTNSEYLHQAIQVKGDEALGDNFRAMQQGILPAIENTHRVEVPEPNAKKFYDYNDMRIPITPARSPEPPNYKIMDEHLKKVLPKFLVIPNSTSDLPRATCPGGDAPGNDGRDKGATE